MKKKKIFIIFLIIIFLFIFSIKNHATNEDEIELICNAIPKEGYVLTIKDFSDIVEPYSGRYILSYSSRYYYIFLLEDEKVVDIDDKGYNFRFYNENNEQVSVDYYKLENNNWTYQGKTDNVWGTWAENYIWRCNVYKSDGSTFFFTTALKSPLAEIVEEAKPQTLLQTIVAIIPLTLVVVVSCLGLRKAWKTLSTLLHQA